MLYNPETDLSSAKRRIAALENKKNAEHIEKFLETLFAEGMSKLRVVKYANHLKMIAERINKDFLKVTEEDIITFLSKLEQQEYSEWTKRDYKIILRRFFQFLKKAELVNNIKITMKKNKKRLPEILTKSEIKKLIDTAENYRDKAVISLLYEGGLRIGELASLKINNVVEDKYGVKLKVRGKTGERSILIISSASLLKKWMDIHPEKNDKNAPLWVSIALNHRKEEITYEGICKRIKGIAKKAGIKKRIHTHIFRHSRATHLATYLTEAEMNEYFGWVQGSNMPATYVHLSGRDIDNKILKMHGLNVGESEQEEEFKSRTCPRCKYINSPTDRFCSRCGAVLDEGEMVKLQMQSKKLAKDFSDLAIDDPKLLLEMKKFVEMIDLFEKKPELFKKMQEISKR